MVHLRHIGETISIICTFLLKAYCRKTNKHHIVAQDTGTKGLPRNKKGGMLTDDSLETAPGRHWWSNKIRNPASDTYGCRRWTLLNSPEDFFPASARCLCTFRAIRVGPSNTVRSRPSQDPHNKRQYHQTCDRQSGKGPPCRLPR